MSISLIFISVLSSVLVSGGLFYYAYQTHLALQVLQEHHFKKHHQILCRILTLLGTLTFINLFGWFYNIQYFNTALRFLIFIQIIKLIYIKSDVLKIQNAITAELAGLNTDDTLRFMQDTDKKDEIKPILLRIEKVLQKVL